MTHQPKSVYTKVKKQEDINENNIENIDKHNLSSNYPSKIPNSKIENYFEKLFNNNSFNQTQLYTFGSNEMGQLGVELENVKNNEVALFCPIPINLTCMNDKQIVSISAGDGHSICVNKAGEVFSWGASACGQLGVDHNEQMQTDSEGYPYQPKPIQVKLLNNIKIKDVACGDAHTLALSFDGLVFSWGGAGCGQLGHNNISTMPRDADACPYQPCPKLIDSLKNNYIIHIACGKAHSMAIDNLHSLFTWGAGACGQLGVEDIHTLPVDDDGYPFQPVPKALKIMKGKEIIVGACGDVHSVILTKKGELFSFGGGSFGQLGLGSISKMPLDSDSYPFMPTPTKIESLSNIVIVKISCGDSHTMAIDSDGKLYAWGAAACGQLGIDNLSGLPKDGEGNPYEPDPKLVGFFENIKVESVACGESHTLVLVEGGTLYSFGNSTCGQLGYIEKREKNKTSFTKSLQNRILESNNSLIGKPKLITSFLGKNVVKMACGGVHNLCLTQTEVPFEYEIFKLYKNELFTDVTLVLENYGNVNESNTISLKVHKFVFSSRSKYFYNMLIKENSTTLVYKNFDEFVFRTIIDYLYIEDMGFIDEIKQTNAILDGLKLSKIFMLKKIEEKFESKLKGILVKYSEALQAIDKTEGLNNVSNKNNVNFIQNSNQENQQNQTNQSSNNNIVIGTNNILTNNEGFSSDSSENQSIINNNNTTNITDILTKDFKGLFFLPNGNPLIIFDDELIEKIMKSSNIININDLNVNKESFNNYRVYSQKNNPQQTNIQLDSSNTSQNKFQIKKNTNIVKQSSIKENVEIDLNDSKLIDENQSVIEKKIKKKWVILFNEYIQEKISLLEYLKSMNIFHNFKLPKYLKFFNDKSSSDVILKVEGVEFYCHKIILVSRSQIFYDMMSMNFFKENKSNVIEISDYPPEEFLVFLIYLYSDHMNLDINSALDLLKGADMYAVTNLKGKLENYLSSSLEIENAAKIFKYSSFYNHEKLKKVALAFIKDNYKSVIDSSEFEELPREFMLEIIRFCKSN